MNRKTQIILLTLCMTLLLAWGGLGTVSAQIGINFTGFYTDGSANLAPTNVAGAIPQANWNNTPGNGPVPGTFAAGEVKDATGAVVPGMEVTWDGSGNYGTGDWPTPDDILFRGFLWQDPAKGTTAITFTNIPYSSYYVMVYIANDGGGRTTQIQLNGAGTSYYVDNIPGGFTGKYIVATTTFLANPAADIPAPANVVVFPNVTGASLTINRTAWRYNDGVGGVQIVPSSMVPLDTLTDELPLIYPAASATGVFPRAVPLVWYYREVLFPGGQFKVYLKQGSAPGAGDVIATLPESTKTFLLPVLSPSSTYYWKVEVFQGANSKFSEVRSFITGTDPAMPSLPVTTGRILHLDATTGVQNASAAPAADGEAVATWVDQSPAGNSVNNTVVPAARPTFKAVSDHGRPSLNFDGTRRLHGASTTAFAFGTADFDVFAVAKDPAYAGNSIVVGNRTATGGMTNNGFWMGWGGNGWAYAGIGSITNTATDVFWGAPDRRALWLIENLSKNSGTYEFFVNNALLNATATPYQSIVSDEPITIGNRSFASSWFHRGEISEVVIYNRRLTGAEKTQVYQYLGTKYTLNKPSLSVVSPAADSDISKDEDVVLRARVLAFIGSTVSNVEFFVNGISVGSTTTPRGDRDYEFTWKPTTTGAKTVVAVATSSTGLVNSASVTVNSLEMAPSVAFSTPSPAMSAGPTVDFPTTFTAVGDTFALTADKVILAASEGSVTGTVSIVAGLLPRTPIIRVTGITGFGKLRVCVLAGAGTSPYGMGDTPAAVSPAAGVYPVLPSPPTSPVAGSKLWWDASNINGLGNAGLNNGDPILLWKDRSGNGNDGTPTGTGATYTASVSGFNNKPAVTFHADRANEKYDFAAGITDVRTVFWAIRKGDTGLHYILGCNTWGGGYGWHGGDVGGVGTGEQIWHRDYAAGEIQNGVTRVNGDPVNGAQTSMYPLGHTIISLEAAGDCTADFFCGDGRGAQYNTRSWMGELAELIIYNRVLTYQERNDTGAYLAGKYGKITAFGYPDVPTVALVYPTVGAAVLPSEAVALKATATPGPGASIAAVEFYADGVLVGTVTSRNSLGQYVVPWTAPATVGRVLIFARALDNRTPTPAAGVSAQVYLSVVNPMFATVTGAGTKDGASWATAMTLDEALTAASAALAGPPIYVKSGTYTRAESYTFTTGLALYGGFAGMETKASQRTGTPGVNNVTTLDGGGVATGIFRNGGQSITLDRLTLTGCAGRPLTLGGYTAVTTINDCTFSNNTSADDPGGAIYIDDGKLDVTRSVFKDNSAGSWGGGAIAQWSGWGDRHASLDGCWFEHNQATGGGGVGGAFTNYWGNLIATNCVFVNNTSDGGGGAIESDGAPAWIFNNTFVGNQSTGGSEFSCVYAGYGGGPGVYVVNNIFSNHAGQTVHTDGAPEVMPVLNNLFYNSPFDAANVAASGTVTGDPLFVNAAGKDFRLAAGSPAIDKGLTGSFLVDVNTYSIPTMDHAGLPRFDGKPDLGAYELAVTGTLKVTPDPLSFGIVAKETTSTKTLTLTNTAGNTPITVSAITPSGAGFALVAPPTLPVTLAPGESVDIVVAFTAPVVTTRVPYAGTVTVANTGAVPSVTGGLKAIAAPSLFPGERPTVVVERSAGTPATTNVFPIEFNITFSEGVTGFELGDINWAAGDVKAGNITGVVLIPREASGALYTLRITEITGMGAGAWTVKPVVPAGVCETVGKYPNLASNTDAVVTYSTALFGAVIATTASDITDATTVTCTVTFNAEVKAVDALALIELKLGLAGTSAGASIASVLETNASTAYTVEITTGGDGTLALTLNDTTRSWT